MQKFFYVFLIIFYISITFLLSLADSSHKNNIDNWGHLGGAIFGFFGLIPFVKPHNIDDGACCKYKIWFAISLFVLGIFTILGFVLYYTLDKYSKVKI